MVADEVRDERDAEELRLVRDAVRHLHDVVALQRHPWGRMLAGATADRAEAARRLQAQLVESIAALDPPAGAGDEKARRRHRLLALRYLEGRAIVEVADALHVSRREFNRQHRHALQALASVVRRPLDRAGLSVATTAGQRLPAGALTSFIGRQRELADLRDLLAGNRCVTVLGAPGTGKTRLVLELPRRLRDADPTWGALFPDGGVLVPLDAVREPGHVAPAIAQALNVRDSPGTPVLQALADRLAATRLLLILDNFEQVTPAAHVVTTLAGCCPQLRILVTSRQPLRLSIEQRYVVSPLPVPQAGECDSAEDARTSDAVRLYVNRACAANHAFRLTDRNAPAVGQICRRLDGLPLAIELAAARVRLFPPDVLTARLSDPLSLLTGGARDVPTRQQTLRNAIDWSYRLLSADEATLLSRLSVFAGGWSIDAVEAVCAPLDEIDTADGLGRLLDHNLIQVQDCAAGSRFALLDTIHHYARTKLDARPDEAHVVCRRHAEFFVALAVRANAEILGPNRGTWLRRLQEELANIRIALAWLRDNGRLDDALQLAGSLQWFWFDGTHWREGRDWLEALLAASPPSARTVGRATALVAAGGCRRGLNEFQAADRLLRDGIEIWRELGDRKELGRALLELSVVANATGDAAAARALTEEGLTCAREGGDGPYIGLALYALGLFTLGDGDQAGAEQQFRAALTAWHDSGSNGLAALGWNALGDLARVQARYSDAADYYRTSLTASDATRQLQAIFRHNLGQALTRLGETAQARALFTDALTRFRELRDVRGVAECVAGLAETLPATAAVPAVEAFAAAMRAIDDLGSHPSPSNHAEYQVFLDTACRSLGEAGIAAATARGRHLTLEQAEALVRRHCVATPTE